MKDMALISIRKDFLPIKNKRILIYGTGAMANRLIKALEGFHIVGVLDRIKLEGNVEGIPVLSWEDIDKNFADILIIGAVQKNVKEIYERIIYPCLYRNIAIFNIDGQNLSECYALENTSIETAQYYLKNKEELKKKIDEYDAVSFDLFDTLIMRRTLEPIDIFDLVELRLQEKGIIISDFKKKRRTAELQSGGRDIYHIYEILSQRLQLDEEKMQIILDEEIQCEKEYMTPRKVIAELMDYATAKGKTVSIISDMYLTSSILADILSFVGITRYNKLYVSCEYGAGKENGLFAEYLKDVQGKKCLHIGDNRQSDILAAEKCGIDAYEVKNAYDMLKISGFRRALIYTNSKCDRLFVGDMIAELFNDPFALYLSSGIVHMTDLKIVLRNFVVPVVVQYMQELYDVLRKQSYQGILFGARDGYLLRKIYESDLVETVENKPKAIYFYTSRKLAVKASIRNREDVDEFVKYLESSKDLQNILMHMFHIEERTADTKQFISQHLEIIKEQAKTTRRHYIQYMENNGIDIGGKYLFCDLISTGTVQSAMDKIFHKELEGVYLYRGAGEIERKISVNSVYSKHEWFVKRDSGYFLEKILTSLEPTVTDMGEGGIPVFGEEDRECDEIDLLKHMQDIICQEVEQFINFLKWDKRLSKNLVCTWLDFVNNTIFEAEAEALNELSLIDDIGINIGRIKIRPREIHGRIC